MRRLRTVLVFVVALALAAPGCRLRDAAKGDASPRDLATGACLGPFCLGRPIAEAERPAQAAAITSGAPSSDVICWRFETTDVAAFVDRGGPEALVRGVLATALPSCGAHPALASATSPDVVDCRGVRLGDPAAFVAKVHRQARPPDADADLWPEAPEGVTALSDICAPGADSAHRTTLYLKDDRVVGIAIGRR
jgi:hypothetical protein